MFGFEVDGDGMRRFVRRLAVAASGLLAAAGGAAETPPPVAGARLSVGDARLSVSFDAASGWPTTWTVDGETVLLADPKTRAPVRVNDFAPWKNLEREAPPAVAGRFERVDGTTATSWLRAGDWRFAVTVQLYPNERMARRRFAFCWDGAAPTQKLERLWFEGAKLRTGAASGAFMLPGLWPPRSGKAPFHDGWSQRTGGGRAGGPAPIICESGSGWSVLSCLDETTPCADRGHSHLMERADGLALSTFYETCGRMRRGDWQEVGDAWFVFRRGTAEAMLAEGLPAWFRHVGEVPPADRADWLKDAVMYSTHPKGDGDEGMRDRGGFKAETAGLPFLKALGVNLIWLRPVEDESCYVPRDYYALMNGIGSAADFKAYVRAAHAMGMRVMRDGVIHGGFSTPRNPRAVTHPEWVGQHEDGSVADFWCFDFNWPTWIAYFGDYIRHQTAEYGLDGWRLDATSGSRHPNWNPAIPYARASFAQLQGAFNQLRSIRANLRKVRADGALLTESHFGAFAKYADSIYDEWRVGARALDEMARQAGPGEVVRALRRWFHEQQFALPPDTINMRYIDNHDTLSLADTHGRAVATAMMAVMAWTPGYPQVCNFREDGAFEALRRIFRLRAALPELRRGAADYMGVDAPDGVFACRRTLGDLESVVLVNFNSDPAAGLAPFGFRVVRTKGPSVARALGELPPFAPQGAAAPARQTPSGLLFELEADGRTIPILAELRNWTNGALRVPYRLVREKTATGWRVRLAEPLPGRSPSDFSNLKLVLQAPAAERWYARTAEGVFEGPFRVRHPDYDALDPRGTIGGAPRDGALRWQSKTHPFGLTRDHAAVGMAFGRAALECHGFAQAADVRVWDRLGKDAGLAVSVYGPRLESYALSFDLTTVVRALDAAQVGTGDSRLKAMPGGWRFEEGTLRVNVLRNGALAAVFRRRGDAWVKVAGEAGFFTDTGTGRRVNTGEIPADCRQTYECECPARLARRADGALTLDFARGELRGFGRHASRMAKPVRFSTHYTFKGDETFGYCTRFETTRPFAKGEGALDWRMDLPSCRGGKVDRTSVALETASGCTLAMAFCDWKGEAPRALVRDGRRLRVVWLGRETEGLDLPPASQHGFTATVRVGR